MYLFMFINILENLLPSESEYASNLCSIDSEGRCPGGQGDQGARPSSGHGAIDDEELGDSAVLVHRRGERESGGEV